MCLHTGWSTRGVSRSGMSAPDQVARGGVLGEHVYMTGVATQPSKIFSIPSQFTAKASSF